MTSTVAAYSPAEAAERIGVSTMSIYRWMEEGALDHWKDGRHRRVSVASVEAFRSTYDGPRFPVAEFEARRFQARLAGIDGCTVEGCGRPVRAIAWCGKHYERSRLAGGSPIAACRVERFWRLFERVQSGCWLWTGHLTEQGYGRFGAGGDGGSVYAHRFSYELLVEPVPEGLEVDHHCHNLSGCPGGRCVHRSCVNPSHLRAVTHAVNTKAGRAGYRPKTTS